MFLTLEKTLDSVQMIPDKYNVTLNGRSGQGNLLNYNLFKLC